MYSIYIFYASLKVWKGTMNDFRLYLIDVIVNNLITMLKI